MPRLSVFIFEISTKENDLEKEIFSAFKKMKVNTTKGLPWEGFLVKEESDALAYEKDDSGTHRFTYVLEYEEEYISIDGKKFDNRKKELVQIWVDIPAKLLMIFTSDAGIAFKVIRMIALQDNHAVMISPLKLEVDFMKWLENVKDYQKSSLQKIIGTRATNLEDNEGNSSVSLTTAGILNKSHLFTSIKDKGNRLYLRGIFQINDSEIEASFYTNCKISLSKKKASNMSMDEAKHSAKTVYQELKKWHTKWKSK
jgi:hypothetical protein